MLQPLDPDKKKLTNFLQWIQTTNIKAYNIEIVYYGDIGVGVQATKNIKSDEIVLQVPYENLITLKMVKEYNLFDHKTKNNNIEFNGPKHTAFAAFLLCERNSNSSKWKPYLDMLPS